MFANQQTYSDNGNLLSLQRSLNGSVVDNLNYTYKPNSNQIDRVEDGGTAAFFENKNANSTDYTYDENGNTTQDLNRGIGQMSYNALNLVRQVVANGQTTTYTYTGAGQKLQANFGQNKKYDYLSAGVWRNDTLEFVPTAEGRFVPKQGALSTGRYEYSLKDHLGNLRVACTCDTALKVSQIVHQDPWGFTLPIGIKGTDRYKFLGREEQAETGWVDLMKRFYDPSVGRFLSVDPLPDAAGQESLSTYQYGWNNPVVKSDPNGDCPDCDEKSDNQQLFEKSLGSFTKDLQSEISSWPGKILSFTDVNDATVIATTLTRGGKAINTDGSQASTSDKFFAFGGAFAPAVSGSAVKKGIEFVGNRAIGAWKALTGKFEQAHHIIQDAAVKNIPGYSKREAPTIHLNGSSKTRGSEHKMATDTQNYRRSIGDGGNYGSERRIAYRSLRAAGLSREHSKQAVKKADDYFNQLGVTPSTTTRIPYTRQQ